ncbi:hypothetical protein FQR65_LT11782 [Abscondita terminalis]|nr:hypothetical protein FQR65_LT11782 [Abscondita terminalis]
MNDNVARAPKWFYVALATAGGNSYIKVPRPIFTGENFLGSLSAFCCGMHNGWTSPSLVKLHAEEIQITSEQGFWIATSLFFGGIAGAVFWNLLSLKITKRMVALVTSIPLLASWLIIAFAQSYPPFLVARILAGISLSWAYCSVPLFLAEISGSSLRGLVITFFPLSISLGSFFINLLGSYASIRTTALISLIFPALSLCLFLFIPDSPYDLIQRKRLEDAKSSLKHFRGLEDVEEDFAGIKDALEQEVAGSYLDLFAEPSYRQALITLLGVRSVNQLTGYTAFKVYLQPNFFPHWCLGFIDRVGRKPLMVFASVVIAVALIIFATVAYLYDANEIDQQFFVYASTTALLVYVSVFSLGLDFAPTVLLGEVFPYFLKPFASTIHEIYHCLLMIIVTKLFQATSDVFGMEAPFLLYATCTIFGIIFIIYCVPETKKKKLEEIQLLLKNKYKR